MKKIGALLGVISLLSVALAAGAFAQDVPWALMKGTKFIGADVENPQGEDLGDIKDVVIDRTSGRIVYAVVSFGGFLGLGEKLFAVPWGAFSQSAADKDTFMLAVDQERLRNAPGFDQNNWPQMVDRDWVSNLYTYYGVTPYWTATTASPLTAATVKNVDQSQKTITLQVDERTLQNLQAGDSAQVTIRKHPGAR
jgi:sporulation protein YlmC with PRC-barrel domain